MKNGLLKTIALILCFVLLLSAAGCGGEDPESEVSGSEVAESNNQKPSVNDIESGLSTEQTAEIFTNKSFIDEMKPYEGSTLKIAFVGDGITYGNGTSDRFSESFTVQLSTLLDNTVRIGNFGKPSAYVLPPENQYNVKAEKPANWYQNTAQFQKSLEYNPDIVVIMLGTNDFRSMSCDEAKADFKAALLDLASKYKELDSVQKVYIATSIIGCSNAAIYEMMTGAMQEIQKEAAVEGGYEVIDIGGMTQSFLDAEFHFTKSKQNPDATGCAEIARAFYAFFKEQPFIPGKMQEASGDVVYVKDGGEAYGEGASPAKAIDSLAKAVSLLQKKGGTVVLCGDCDLGYEMVLPVSEKPITITGSHDGKDYGAKLILSHNLHFNGEFTIENLHIEVTKENGMLVCGYNNITFGEGLTCSWGEKASGYPGITAGYNQQIAGCPTGRVSHHGKCSVTIKSGHWGFVRGGNARGNAKLHLADVDAGAELSINITGGVFENITGKNLTAATGMNNVSGLCRLNISGGTFMGPVFALARHGALAEGDAYAMNGRAELEITGGDFKDGIHAYQDEEAIASGQITVTVTRALSASVDQAGFTKVTFK
ncbi:MAG: hypothetical protein IJU01_03080 [Lachnospiraceae bacterium]|nr:hypothetical protein [Lachnospiraceae bacterium]